MRRLYLQIYFAFLGIVALFAALGSAAWFVSRDGFEERAALDGLAAVAAELLPGADRPTGEHQRAVDRLGARLGSRITVRSAAGALLAAHGEPLPAAPAGTNASGWFHIPRLGPAIALQLPDGRRVVAYRMREGRGSGLLLALGLLALVSAAGAYPLARRITRRLERLQARVDALGEGDFSARVEVEGRDEVAQLAQRFNRAADRIEQLVAAQRGILASASHELRTPLARMRVAVELLGRENRPELRERLVREISELDGLIEEILLASRLDAIDRLEHVEEMDVLAIAAEEAARTGAQARGAPALLAGDARLVRRLIRNLLENAARHAPGAPAEIAVEPAGDGGVVVRVADRGPGVPPAERERIFEPFHRAAESGTRGTGLGLALVRQIARRHGGDARCLDAEGGGACFEARLQPRSGVAR